MRQTILLGRALRPNALQFTKLERHAALSTITTSLLRARPPTHLLQTQTPGPRPFSSTRSQQHTTTTTTNTTTSLTHPASPLAANPPPTTRPPPLTLPTRDDPTKSTFRHYLSLGMAYLKFYKTGLKQIITNTRLLYSASPSQTIQDNNTSIPKPLPSTRAHLHLRLRWQHDFRRLPLFALILLICGEFTPVVVLLVPRAVPLTCRIPRQVEGLLRGVEEKRREGRQEVDALRAAGSLNREGGEVPDRVLAKILGVAAKGWTPGWVLGPRVQRRLRFLGVDDALLIQAGGVPALVEEEVRLACTDRGVDVLGRGEKELREVLGKWLRLTDARRLGEEGSEKAVVRLLTTKESEWGA